MTSSELATRNGASSDIAWSDDQRKLVASVIAPGCNTDELRLFAYHCQRTGLDPFSRQIYAIKRGGKMTVQVSIDGLRAIAERTGELGGSQRFWCGTDGQWQEVWLDDKPPSAAKCVVYRKGCPHPFVGVALFRDYNAGQGLWTKMPSVMLGKCAEAQALRSGFPADLSGLYTTEEMDQADHRAVEVNVVPAPAVNPPQEVQPAPVTSARPAPPVQPPAASQPEVVDVEANEAPPAAEPAEASVAAPVSIEERLLAAVNRLSATGKRALIKAYSSILAFSDIETVDDFLGVAYKNDPQVHLNGLTDNAIAALNQGKHPRTNEQLVNKPGRRPAAGQASEQDPENPFG
jgi:phage recombination protein Bet